MLTEKMGDKAGACASLGKAGWGRLRNRAVDGGDPAWYCHTAALKAQSLATTC